LWDAGGGGPQPPQPLAGNELFAAAVCPVSLSEEAGQLASCGGAAVAVMVETDPCSHVGAVMEAAPTATIGAGADIISQCSPWSGGAISVARAATIAPSGANFVPAAAATTTAVATATIAAAVLLLLTLRRLLSPGGNRATHCRHGGRVAVPHFP
jgi:hypothetical protein